ncbi:MAG TPA: sugar phosphate isomerase/epimerase family protein [Verrucomicrobiae bacterium]|nr:sugar phosphate isomerase/epimerase family protein [Verrucomicrobiae bacterium]
MYYFSGIGDEAANKIDDQIRAIKALGWANLEARGVEVPGFPKGNIHDLPDQAFDILVEKVQSAGIQVNCFGSAIANWGKKIGEPGESSLAEARRCIPRMNRLGTKFVRIMSFAVRKEEDQMADERFRRLREITKMFLDNGLQPVHENCMNYGGMGWPFTLELLEQVPGLKLVFDTGNPIFNEDRSKPKPWPKQDPWEFYEHVKEHIVHVHVKDARWNTAKNDADYTMPGDGDGKVQAILQDLLASGYDGAISIEPHVAVVFHDANVKASDEQMFDSFVEYGQRLMRLVDEIMVELKVPEMRAKAPLMAAASYESIARVKQQKPQTAISPR